MLFPEVLTVRVVEAESQLPVPEVALILVLKALRKNDYYVGPIITGREGRAEFTRALCERTILRAQEMFVMDYAGDLSSCGPIADLSLHRPDHIARMIQQYDAAPQFWGRAFEDARTLFRRLRSVENARFESAHVKLQDSEIVKRPELSMALKRVVQSRTNHE